MSVPEHTACLCVAGVRFEIRSHCPIAEPFDDRTRLPFTKHVDSPVDPVDVNVRLVQGGLPDLGGRELLFESNAAWRMYRDADTRWIVRTAQGRTRTLWIAEFGRAAREVTVHCADACIEERQGQTVILNPIRFPLDQILLMHALADHGGMIVHAAGAVLGRSGCVLAGRSGRGKSTVARRLADADGTRVLSDDRIVIRAGQQGWHMFGTPWPGDAGMAANAAAPLAALFFLEHAATDRAPRLEAREALDRLLPVSSIPWYDKALLPSVLDTCEQLLASVPAHALQLRRDAPVAALLRECVTGYVGDGSAGATSSRNPSPEPNQEPIETEG